MRKRAPGPIDWPAGPKMLVWDIEAMSHDFNPAMGEILMVAFQHPEWEDPRIVRIDDFPGWKKLPIEERDRHLCRWVGRNFADAEVLVGHYTTGFDRPFVNARLMHHGFDPLSPSVDVDTWKVSKRAFSPSRRNYGQGLPCSLDSISQFLRVDHAKGKIDRTVWRRAMTNDEDAFDEIAPYCVQDVRVTLDLFNKLKVLPGAIPQLQMLKGNNEFSCVACGSHNLQWRGYYVTTANRYRRFQCQDCGKWGRENTANLKRGESLR